MTLASNLISVAARAVALVGRSVTIRRGATSVTLTATDPLDYADRLIDGDAVRAGDAQIVAAASALGAFLPQPGDFVDVGTDTWVIVDVSRHAVQGSLIAVEMHVRKGAGGG